MFVCLCYTESSAPFHSVLKWANKDVQVHINTSIMQESVCVHVFKSRLFNLIRAVDVHFIYFAVGILAASTT